MSDQTGSTLKHFGAGWGSEIWDPSVTSIRPSRISGLSSVGEFLVLFYWGKPSDKPLDDFRQSQKTRPLLLNFTKDNDGRALREHIQIKHHQNPSNNYSFNGLGFSLSNFSLEGWQPRSKNSRSCGTEDWNWLSPPFCRQSFAQLCQYQMHTLK